MYKNYDARECEKQIRLLVRQAENCYYEIDKIAKQYISDFHFMDHKVSTFWHCDKSPIGMCVFLRNKYDGKVEKCRYCGGPQERK